MRVFETIQPVRASLSVPAFQARSPQDMAETAPEKTVARTNRFSNNRTAGSMPVWQPRNVGHAAFAPESDTPHAVAGSEQKLGFKDLVDVINPLQHIPVVNTVYRKLTGDEISTPAQFIGATIFGGPIGGAAALANLALREQTGKDLGDTMMSLVTGKDPASQAPSIETRVLAERWSERRSMPTRMAGAQPVWTPDAARPSMKPGTPFGRPLAPETEFAVLLNDLTSINPNIS